MDLLEARAQLYDEADIAASADYLFRHGIDRDELEAHAGLLAIVRGEILPGDRWEFEPQGDPLAVVEAFDADDETVIDLVAWPEAAGAPMALTMFGRASVLGASRIRNPATFFGGRPLMAFRTPLTWLQAGCCGVVVLDPNGAINQLVEASGSIAGEDIPHARELVRLLRHYVPVRRIVAPLPKAA